MAKYNIHTQFDKTIEFIKASNLIAPNTFEDLSENKIFTQLQLIEDRNILAVRPIYKEVCGWSYSLRKLMCSQIPVMEYTLVDGQIQSKQKEEEVIVGNGWFPVFEQYFIGNQLETKIEKLRSQTSILVDKMEKSGTDYIAQADMIKLYVCNSLGLMRGIGNFFLHIIKGRLFFATYTGLYDTSVGDEFVTRLLIQKGLLSDTDFDTTNSNHDSFLSDLHNDMDIFLTQLQQFATSATNEEKESFILQSAYDSFGNPIFSLAYLIDMMQNKNVAIEEWLDYKIELVNRSIESLDKFMIILKIISTIAIVFNSSGEATELLKVLAKEAPDNYAEKAIAISFAIEEKWKYSQAELGKAMALAIRKTVNHFNYFNDFEEALDLIFEQGIPQYDKVTT
jgi:hypothetical protein